MGGKRKSKIAIKPSKEGTLTAIARREGGLLKSGKVSRSWARKKLSAKNTRASTKKKLNFFLNFTGRKKNPTTQKKLRQACRLFERFRGEEPGYIDEMMIDIPDVGIVVGTLDGVLYSADRDGDGKTEQYIHEFKGRSRPMLASTWDGKYIFPVGGHYDFTEDGIKDRRRK